jgi:hypothetical protein
MVQVASYGWLYLARLHFYYVLLGSALVTGGALSTQTACSASPASAQDAVTYTRPAYHHLHRLLAIFSENDLRPILVDTGAVDPSSDGVDLCGRDVVLSV